MSADDVPVEIRRLPPAARRSIVATVMLDADGDWSRVTIADGVVIVHNRPQPDGLGMRVEPEAAPEPVVQAAPEPVVQAAPEPEPEPEPEPPVAKKPVARGPRRRAKPALADIPLWPAIMPSTFSPPAPEPPARPPVASPFAAPAPVEPVVRPRLQPMPSRPLIDTVPDRLRAVRDMQGPQAEKRPVHLVRPGTGQYDAEALMGSFFELLDAVATGIGEGLPLQIHRDVTALTGVSMDTVEHVVRYADRAELDSSSTTKGYPIVRFTKADVMVVVGFRERVNPMVVAAYFESRLMPEHRRGLGSGAPGGRGATDRSSHVAPTRTDQLLPRIVALGAKHEPLGPTPVNVLITFEGEDLGRVNVGPTATRSSVQADYLRIRRKVEGIKRARGMT